MLQLHVYQADAKRVLERDQEERLAWQIRDVVGDLNAVLHSAAIHGLHMQIEFPGTLTEPLRVTSVTNADGEKLDDA